MAHHKILHVSGVILLNIAMAHAFADEPSKAKVIPEVEAANTIRDIKGFDLIKTGDVIIDKDMLFNGWFIKADKVVFKSGAKLIFSRQAQESRRNFFIVAKELVSEDASAPGIITYAAAGTSDAEPAQGQAATGPHAAFDDNPGGPGQPGQQGPSGPLGYAAPSLTVVALNVPQSGVRIEFAGQKGGKGGQGQRGGDGGNGAKGHPATISMVDCKNGAGDGGVGGPGGPGGTGGIGGRGGNGGNVTLIAPIDLLPSLTQKMRVIVSGGPGGDPGEGGPGGKGGLGGPRGAKALPYCKDDGRDGSPGAAGPGGGKGNPGGSGIDGDFFVGGITPDAFSRIY